MTTDIKPDTSLYPNDLPSRFRALALIAEGQEAGKQAQLLNPAKGWRDGFFEFSDRATHYRLKPEPRVVWVNFNETTWGSLASNVYTSEQAAHKADAGEYQRIATAVRVELPE